MLPTAITLCSPCAEQPTCGLAAGWDLCWGGEQVKRDPLYVGQVLKDGAACFAKAEAQGTFTRAWESLHMSKGQRDPLTEDLRQ